MSNLPAVPTDAVAATVSPAAPTLQLSAGGAAEVEARPQTRSILAFGFGVCLAFFSSFTAWSVMAPLSEAAIAPGIIKSEGNRRTIQHLEGGIVREILVRDGTKVRAGQVLLRLDDIQTGSTLETLRAQRWALLAHKARLRAEIDRQSTVTFPAALQTSQEARAVDAMTGQNAVFEARHLVLGSQIAVQESKIEQQQATATGARGQLRAQAVQLALIRQEEEMARGLVQQGLQRLPALLALQRAAAGLEGAREELQSQIDRAEAAIAESRKTIDALVQQRQQDATTELRDVSTRLAEVEERLRAAQDVSGRRDIVAPEDGTVLNLRLFTVGAVVRPGEPVLDLVPDQDRLIAEVNVQPYDIDVVHTGMQSEVRLPAFKQRLVPYLHGHVTFVARDVTIDERTRSNYFRAHILIDREQLERLNGVSLVPGMPVEAQIQIGQRSFMRYMMQPILDSFARAFREQ